MTICERMYAILDSSPGKSAAGLAKALGVKTAQTTNWRTRNTDPPAKYITYICKYLDISVLFLLTGESTDDGFVEPDERELLEKFRLLGKVGQRAVLAEADEQLYRQKLEGDNRKTAT